MALTEKVVDFELRVIIHIHPVLLADVGVDDEGAIVILVRIVDRLGDVVLRERGVGHVGELADRNIAHFALRFVVLRFLVLFHGRQFRHLRLILTVITLPILAARRIAPPRTIGPDVRCR